MRKITSDRAKNYFALQSVHSLRWKDYSLDSSQSKTFRSEVLLTRRDAMRMNGIRICLFSVVFQTPNFQCSARAKNEQSPLYSDLDELASIVETNIERLENPVCWACKSSAILLLAGNFV